MKNFIVIVLTKAFTLRFGVQRDCKERELGGEGSPGASVDRRKGIKQREGQLNRLRGESIRHCLSGRSIKYLHSLCVLVVSTSPHFSFVSTNKRFDSSTSYHRHSIVNAASTSVSMNTALSSSVRTNTALSSSVSTNTALSTRSGP